MYIATRKQYILEHLQCEAFQVLFVAHRSLCFPQMKEKKIIKRYVEAIRGYIGSKQMGVVKKRIVYLNKKKSILSKDEWDDIRVRKRWKIWGYHSKLVFTQSDSQYIKMKLQNLYKNIESALKNDVDYNDDSDDGDL